MTVFPGIAVIRIDTEESVIGSGGTEEDFIEGFIRSITPEQIDEKLGDRDKLVYTLSIEATTSTSAKAKAKSFVRLKNPFEITNVQITSLELGEEKTIFNTYTVGVGVTKAGLGD